ncbi:hypothetical protein [Pseudobacteroides cellulosolvens]|uniref:Uncharacterized protein n=1 Tax=Pseudobacteroides cellulosolvens ATCC 35603 = DSM 2933 TaxID=398512 RepID=A0A0L6JP49_9FIRM|nr:hypothetical protein [Pseudobacteroides cellulosolvens]KNY27616.1 hypothetical protein Bccel_2887 [Pseudobacteroides cellulosolvens ATCC 35603 = DSM 2933]
MIMKCPHCYERVFPKQDNTCPSCGKNVLDTTEDMECYDLVELKDKQKLPEICFVCGESTKNKAKISYSRKYGSKDYLIVKLIVLIFSPIIFLFSLIANQNRRFAKIKVYMPICGQCSKKERPEPKYINYDNYSICFIVHKNFKDAFVNVNSNNIGK